MPSLTHNTPALRFPGYTGVWEQQRLGNITNRITRKNTHLESDIPLTLSAQYGLIDQNEFFNKRIASKDISGYYLVRNGEFAYNKSTSSDAPWGAIERLDRYDQGVLSTLYIVFGVKDPQEINSDYLVSYYQTNLWHCGIQAIASEGARNHGLLNITPADFFDTTISVPSDYREQSLIGSFFRKLDDLLALHQRQTQKLTELKKGLLQKMFPQEGESVPRLRFPGFTTHWEQQKLSDVASITMGQSPDGSTYSTTPQGHILIQGNADLSHGWVSPRVWTTQVTKTCDAGDIIMSVRAPAGAIGRTQYNAVIGRGVAAIKGNDFIYQSLARMDDIGYWRSLVTGSTFESINSTDLKNAELCVPSLPEQQKIGSFFHHVDDLIHLHQQQTEKLTELKTGLLQKMFPQD